MLTSVIEKAFAFAKTGSFASWAEIDQHMRKAGLSMIGDFDGPDLRKRLNEVCGEARGQRARPAIAPAKPRKLRARTRPSVF